MASCMCPFNCGIYSGEENIDTDHRQNILSKEREIPRAARHWMTSISHLRRHRQDGEYESWIEYPGWSRQKSHYTSTSRSKCTSTSFRCSTATCWWKIENVPAPVPYINDAANLLVPACVFEIEIHVFSNFCIILEVRRRCRFFGGLSKMNHPL